MENGIEVTFQKGYAGLYTAVSFQAGALLLPLMGRIQSHPSRYSIQIASDAHLVSDAVDPQTPSPASMWAFMNHSCRPKVHVDLPRRVMVAARPIDAGEELTFNYNSTEWEMAEPFQCRCGADTCYGLVQGFKHLPEPQQEALQWYAAPHISRLYEEHCGVNQPS